MFHNICTTKTHIHACIRVHTHTQFFFVYTVPSGVTAFNVRSISPHELFILWELPDVTNGILTGYEATVYNVEQNFNISISLSPSVLNCTISNDVGECIIKLLYKYFNCIYMLKLKQYTNIRHEDGMLMPKIGKQE